MNKVIKLFGDDYYESKGRENFEIAFSKIIAKEYYEAFILFEEALKYQPLNAEYAFYCGLSAYYLNEQSSEYFKKSASFETENAEYQMWYGISLYSECDYDKAKQILLYAYSLDDQQYKIRLYYIKSLNQLKQYEATEHFVLNTQGIDRASSDELFELGYSYWNRIMVSEAEEVFIKSINLNKENIISYYFLSRLYCREGIFEKAISILEELVNACPEEKEMVEKQIKAIEMMQSF